MGEGGGCVAEWVGGVGRVVACVGCGCRCCCGCPVVGVVAVGVGVCGGVCVGVVVVVEEGCKGVAGGQAGC